MKFKYTKMNTLGADEMKVEAHNETDFSLPPSPCHLRLENSSVYLLGLLPALQFADFRENETYIKVSWHSSFYTV